LTAVRSSHPKSLDNCNIRYLERYITSTRDIRRQALNEIKNILNLSICTNIVQKTIVKDVSIGYRIERKKPSLNGEKNKAPLKFSKDRIY